MLSIKIVLRISCRKLIKTMLSSHMICALLSFLSLLLLGIDPLLRFCIENSLTINPFEIFILLTSNPQTNFIYCIGIIMLLSCNSLCENASMEVIRARSRGIFFFSQLIAIILTVLIYWIIFMALATFYSYRVCGGLEWSRAIRLLAHGARLLDGGIMPISSYMLIRLNFCEGAFHSVTLMLLYGVFLGIGIYYVNLISSVKIGFPFALALHGGSVTVLLGNIHQLYSYTPLIHAQLQTHDFGGFGSLPKVWHSYIVFLLTITLIILLSYQKLQRIDLSSPYKTSAIKRR